MSRKREVSIGSAWSRSDGNGTVPTGESAIEGVGAAGGAGRGRGTRGGVAPRLDDGRGAPPGPNPQSVAAVHFPLLSRFVGASSTTEGLVCQP